MIPNGTLVQILSHDKIDFSHYYLDSHQWRRGTVLWCMTSYCNMFGYIIYKRKHFELVDYYQIAILDDLDKAQYTFHESSFRVTAKEIAAALSI